MVKASISVLEISASLLSSLVVSNSFTWAIHIKVISIVSGVMTCCSMFTAVFGSSSLSCVSASFNSVFFFSGYIFWIVPKLVFSPSLHLLCLDGKFCVALLSSGYIWLYLISWGPLYYLL